MAPPTVMDGEAVGDIRLISFDRKVVDRRRPCLGRHSYAIPRIAVLDFRDNLIVVPQAGRDASRRLGGTNRGGDQTPRRRELLSDIQAIGGPPASDVSAFNQSLIQPVLIRRAEDT